MGVCALPKGSFSITGDLTMGCACAKVGSCGENDVMGSLVASMAALEEREGVGCCEGQVWMRELGGYWWWWWWWWDRC